MAELIVALDVPRPEEALQLADELCDLVPWYKVGLELFLNAGPDMVRQLKARGSRVFLDLKIYDIPRTAAAAAIACGRMGADMLTAHCQGGRRMCEAMREALDAFPRPPLLAGVTALTSFASGEMPGIREDPGAFGLELADLAAQWGLQCVVCSPLEARAVRSLGLMAVCPGIRPAATDVGDQRRVSTPSAAVSAGANFLVVGRPIVEAADRRAATRRILEEMAVCPANS